MENKKTFKEETKETTKVKVGTLGNFVLAAFVILIVGTGTLTYYLIHTAKDDYDKQYNDIVANITGQEFIADDEDEEEESDATIANIIDSAIADVQAQTNNANNGLVADSEAKKLLNDSLYVLYNGMIINTDVMDEVTPHYIDTTAIDADKYVITYYSYGNYKFQNSTLGLLSNPIGNGLVKIDDVARVALSEEYNAMPRNVKIVNTVPEIVLNNNPKISDYDTIKTIIVDLDGNGTEEYILVLANKTKGYSKITLFDSSGTKKDDLASIEKSKWKKDSTAGYYLSISNIEILDIDDDGIMEILIEIPHATTNSTVSLLKYNNGILNGKTKIECSLISD